MRRFGWIVLAAVLVLGGALAVAGAYDAGLSAGIAEGIARTEGGAEVVIVEGGGFRNRSFPFGFLFFPLFLLLLVALFAGKRHAWHRHHHGGHWGGPPPWAVDRAASDPRLAEVHRRLHEQDWPAAEDDTT